MPATARPRPASARAGARDRVAPKFQRGVGEMAHAYEEVRLKPPQKPQAAVAGRDVLLSSPETAAAGSGGVADHRAYLHKFPPVAIHHSHILVLGDYVYRV